MTCFVNQGELHVSNLFLVCIEPLVFTSSSAVAVSRVDAFSYQVDGFITTSDTKIETTVYYDVINDNALFGQAVFNKMTVKFKGKK